MTQPVKKSRRALLEEFLAAHPQDSFARYGLAMECANQNDAAAAIDNFEKLLAENPNYVAVGWSSQRRPFSGSSSPHCAETL